MKLILNEDIKGTGKKGELIEVSDGYARNFLLPKKLAKMADAAALNEFNSKQKAVEHHYLEAVAAAKELKNKIDNKTIIIKVKSGENGKLFGAVTSKEIAAELSSKFGISPDKKKISLDSEIKSLGSYVAMVKLMPEISAAVTIAVEAE